MGDFKTYNASGGFDQFLYYQIGDIIVANNGAQGKVVNEISDKMKEDFHGSLPMYSNTSKVYFKKSDEGDHSIEQARIYINRKVAFDFDWGHTHADFNQGVVHVHEWHFNSKGKWVRARVPRGLNLDEIKEYGELLKLANPNVKLR